MFLMSLEKILSTFVLTLGQYRRWNYLILRLRDLLLFVLALVVFGITTFSDSIWIYWDGLMKKNFTQENVRDPFNYCFSHFFTP